MKLIVRNKIGKTLYKQTYYTMSDGIHYMSEKDGSVLVDKLYIPETHTKDHRRLLKEIEILERLDNDEAGIETSYEWKEGEEND